MIVKSILSKLNTRVFEYEGKVYTSFTPSMQGDPNNYQIYEAMSCDVEGFILYLNTTDPKYGNSRDYCLNTVAQLRYNNPHISSFSELLEVFRIWILSWRGNEELDWNMIKPFINKYEEDIMEDPVRYIIKSRMKSHWYPLKVELITDHFNRRRAKRKLRDEAFTSSVREDIRIESDHFRNSYWSIKPTARYLSEVVDSSLSTVKKYGHGHYAPQKEVTQQFIAQFKEMHPGLSQSKLRDKVEEYYGISFSIGTIKNYWNANDNRPEVIRPGRLQSRA